MNQNALTVAAPIIHSKLDGLRNLLLKMNQNPQGNAYLPLEKSKLTHFCRFVVIDPTAPQDETTGRILVFETNFDGDLQPYLQSLIGIGAKGLDAVFGCCENYPGSSTKKFDLFQGFIQKYAIPYEAFYVAYRGHSLAGVRQNTQVRKRIEKLLGFDKSSPKLTVQQMQAEGLKVGKLIDSPPQAFSVQLEVFGALVILVLGLLFSPLFWLLPYVTTFWIAWLCGAGFVLLLALLLLTTVELVELGDPQIIPKPIPTPAVLLDAEDHIAQNQITHIVDIKPGFFRLWVLRFVLRSINLLARISYNRGNLGGIPSIHFARWVILEESRRLLFFSNFDGSWESYLGDFIDKAHLGLTGVWSNTVDFPRALFLAWAGATNEEAFKDWTRNHQIQTQFWYSAHASESVRNILNNIRIREGIQASLTDTRAKQWRARF